MYYTTLFYFCMWIINVQVSAEVSDGLNPIKVDLSVWYQRNPRVAMRTNNQLECEKPGVYVCEEPSDFTPAYSNKMCNYRSSRYQEQVYKWVAGRGCLFYTPNFLYVGGRNSVNLNAGCVYGDLLAPCLEIAKEDDTCGCYPFDPAFEEVARIVRNATVPSAHGRWEKCFYEASDCCNHHMGTANNLTDFMISKNCETTFDGWTCWHAVPAGTVATSVCSELAYFNTGPTCNHYSSKECFANGTWNPNSEYETCSVSPRLLSRYWFYIGILAGSTAACLPAAFIFVFYKRLRITRVALHRNLLIAIIIRNTLVIISRITIYMEELTSTGETAMSTNGGWCRVVAALERAAASAVFSCMLVEGVYLHWLVVLEFRQHINIRWLYGLAAVLALAPVTGWGVVMSLYNDHSCWLVYTAPHVQWILDAPRILSLLVSALLFTDTLRALLTKIRNSENSNHLSAAKATLSLIPLFGVQFLFTALRPNTSDCSYEQGYYYVVYTVEALQGFIVALLYCYINKEVHELIKASYKKTEIVFIRGVRNSQLSEIDVHPNDRRMTYSTELPADYEDKRKSYSMKPKYVAEIISIQASERLAEILDPVYETLDIGLTNGGYDRLERFHLDNDSSLIPNRNSKVDDYYGFTNVSSVSIGYQDWLKDTPSYNSSIDNAVETLPSVLTTKGNQNNIDDVSDTVEYVDMDAKNVSDSETQGTSKEGGLNAQPNTSCDNMLEEIMQYIQTKADDEGNDEEITLHADTLPPE